MLPQSIWDFLVDEVTLVEVFLRVLMLSLVSVILFLVMLDSRLHPTQYTPYTLL